MYPGWQRNYRGAPGKYRLDVEHDGGCLFSVWAAILRGDSIYGPVVRREVVEYACNNFQTWGEVLAIYHPFLRDEGTGQLKPDAVEIYRAYMSRQIAWGTTAEILLLCEMHGIGVTVYGEFVGSPQQLGDPDAVEQYHIYNAVNAHFELLQEEVRIGNITMAGFDPGNAMQKQSDASEKRDGDARRQAWQGYPRSSSDAQGCEARTLIEREWRTYSTRSSSQVSAKGQGGTGHAEHVIDANMFEAIEQDRVDAMLVDSVNLIKEAPKRAESGSTDPCLDSFNSTSGEQRKHEGWEGQEVNSTVVDVFLSEDTISKQHRTEAQVGGFQDGDGQKQASSKVGGQSESMGTETSGSVDTCLDSFNSTASERAAWLETQSEAIHSDRSRQTGVGVAGVPGKWDISWKIGLSDNKFFRQTYTLTCEGFDEACKIRDYLMLLTIAQKGLIAKLRNAEPLNQRL